MGSNAQGGLSTSERMDGSVSDKDENKMNECGPFICYWYETGRRSCEKDQNRSENLSHRRNLTCM
jgi:hypothetical protein